MDRAREREPDKKEPTVGQQIAFIMENHQILDRPTKIQILNIVRLEVENFADVFGADDTNGVDIDLDACATKYPDVIRPIYNLVQVRRRTLNQPAREKIDGGLGLNIEALDKANPIHVAAGQTGAEITQLFLALTNKKASQATQEERRNNTVISPPAETALGSAERPPKKRQ